jgi:hypothetical protein
MKTTTKLLLCFIAVFFSRDVVAQSTIHAAGKSASTSNTQHDYSIGEMTLVHTASNAHLIITQGLLQPDDIAKDANATIDIAINVYPNPTADIVYVDFYADANTDVQILVLDVNGKVLATQNQLQVSGSQKIAVPMQAYANGNYILKTVLKQAAKQQQTNLKIVKQ